MTDDLYQKIKQKFLKKCRSIRINTVVLIYGKMLLCPLLEIHAPPLIVDWIRVGVQIEQVSSFHEQFNTHFYMSSLKMYRSLYLVTIVTVLP